MRIVVISDTHIPDRARALPKLFLNAAKDADFILHAGDLVDLSVIKELERIAPLKAVSGNMDSLEVRKILKPKEVIKIGNISIGMMHGVGNPADLTRLLQEEFKGDRPDVIIFGHSHEPFNKKIGNTLFFNPGSLTDSFHAGFTSFGIISVEDGKINAKIEKFNEE